MTALVCPLSLDNITLGRGHEEDRDCDAAGCCVGWLCIG